MTDFDPLYYPPRIPTSCDCDEKVQPFGIIPQEDVRRFGCTDPNASNYDRHANVDDGSCVYLPIPVYGCTNPAASNYNPSANVDDGSCEFGSSDVVFDTAGKKLIETKIGANIFESEVNQMASWVTRANQVAFQTYYYTPVNANMNNGNATLVNNFLSAVSADVGVYYPIQNDAVQLAFPTFLDWLIATFNPTFIQLDQETITIKDRPEPSWTNAIYIARCQQVFGYTGVPCSWDCGLMYKTNGATIARNNAIAPLSSPPSRGRQYEQLQDLNTYSATDQIYNLNLLNNYFGNLLPTYLAQFYSTLPNLTKEIILQWQNADFDDPIKLPDALDNFAIGKMVEFTLANTESFEYLFWMQASNLFHGTLKREFTSLVRVVPCFKFTYTMSVAIPLDGCTAQGFSDGANSFCILINNQSGNSHTILSTDISIPTKTVSGNFTRNTGYATSWNGAMINDDAISEADITVRPYSVSVVTFTTI